MQSKRSYPDGCATAHALDLIGERWALLVVRELMLGPKRFTDLRHGLPAVSPAILTTRLAGLEEASIVTRRKVPPPYASTLYELTDWGRELEPVIKAIGRWGARSPFLTDAPMSIASVMMSFRTMFDPDRARGLMFRLGMQFDQQEFLAEVGRQGLSIHAGTSRPSEAQISGDHNVLADVIYGARTLDDAITSGALRVEGARGHVDSFVALFPLPEQAPDLSFLSNKGVS